MKHKWRQSKVYRVVLALLVLTAVAFLTAHIFWTKSRRLEPVYHGRTLTEWLKRLDDGEVGGISSRALPAYSRRQQEAADAIRAMGQEALPLLMQDLHATPRPDAFRFRASGALMRHTPHFLQPFVWIPDVTEPDRIRWRAAQGLAALGPLAKGEIPELQRLLFTNFFHSSIKEAAYVLATVGPEGVAILTNAPQVNEWSGMCAIWALGQHPMAGTNVIPFLITATTSGSEGTACGAIQVLGLFHLDAEQVVPALTAALSSLNLVIKKDAARALGEFGPNAKSAVAQLQGLTNDPAVRKVALHALRRIESRGP